MPIIWCTFRHSCVGEDQVILNVLVCVKSAEISQCFLWTFGLTEPCSCWLLCVIMPTWIALSAWMARGSLYVTCIVSTCVCLLQRFVPAAAVMNMALQGPVLDYKTACAYLKLIKMKTNSCAKKGGLWEEILASRKLVWVCFDRVLLCFFKNRFVGIDEILETHRELHCSWMIFIFSIVSMITVKGLLDRQALLVHN